MARITVTPEEFADIVVALLFDKVVNPSLISKNEEFTKIVDDIKQKGLKSRLMKYWLNTDPRKRILYKKFIKPLLKETGEKTVIEVATEKEIEATEKKKKKKGGVVKKIFKKIIGNEAVTRKELAFLAEEIMRED